MASSKVVVLVLFFTCISLANSAAFRTKPWEQTVKEREDYGGGYSTGLCPHGCCVWGRSCIGCCRYPNEEINSVGMQKRGHGGCKYGCCGGYAYGQCRACCSRGQVAEKAKEKKASPVWAQSRP